MMSSIIVNHIFKPFAAMRCFCCKKSSSFMCSCIGIKKKIPYRLGLCFVFLGKIYREWNFAFPTLSNKIWLITYWNNAIQLFVYWTISVVSIAIGCLWGKWKLVISSFRHVLRVCLPTLQAFLGLCSSPCSTWQNQTTTTNKHTQCTEPSNPNPNLFLISAEA